MAAIGLGELIGETELEEGVKTYRTDSERLFADYLEERGMAYRYEPVVGSRRPDFLVHGRGQDFIIEVAEIETPVFPDTVGPFDPFPVIRRKIHRKSKQVAAAKGVYPVVLVLYFQHPTPDAEILIPGAMYGNDGWEVPLSSGDAKSGFRSMRRVFLQGGELQPSKNTRISAVAVMECSNPTRMIAKREFDRRYGSLAKRDQRVFLKTHWEVFDNPKYYNPDLLLPRLDVFCNVYAELPLSLEAFAPGPHDRRWDIAGRSGYRCIYLGRRFESEVRPWKASA